MNQPVKILKCNKVNGRWEVLFVAVTGGICFITAKWIDEIIQQIAEVNRELAEVVNHAV